MRSKLPPTRAREQTSFAAGSCQVVQRVIDTRRNQTSPYPPRVGLILRWASNVLALWVATLVFDGITYDDRFWVILVAAVVFALVNLVVRPIVILLALPAVIVTLGIALLFVNALMLYLTDKIVPPFEVEGFWTLVGGALLVWAVNMVIHAVIEPDRKDSNIRQAFSR
jgi:putative membrane protein